MHYDRISFETSLINDSDRFGNTAIHHASSVGNTIHVLELLMYSTIDLQARNTSGETFLHVFCMHTGKSFSKFICSKQEVLMKAIELGFDFSIRDYRGITVESRPAQAFQTG